SFELSYESVASFRTSQCHDVVTGFLRGSNLRQHICTFRYQPNLDSSVLRSVIFGRDGVSTPLEGTAVTEVRPEFVTLFGSFPPYSDASEFDILARGFFCPQECCGF